MEHSRPILVTSFRPPGRSESRKPPLSRTGKSPPSVRLILRYRPLAGKPSPWPTRYGQRTLLNGTMVRTRLGSAPWGSLVNALKDQKTVTPKKLRGEGREHGA